MFFVRNPRPVLLASSLTVLASILGCGGGSTEPAKADPATVEERRQQELERNKMERGM